MCTFKTEGRVAQSADQIQCANIGVFPTRTGFLKCLRTRAEVQAIAETIEVPNRSASELLNVLRDVVPATVTPSLQHLRRFAKPEFLPRHLQGINDSHDSADVSTSSEEQTTSTRTTKSTTSHLLICPTSTVRLCVLETIFEDNYELFLPLRPQISQVVAPLFAPVSAVQAIKWSQDYWPTIYKNTNPYGPHSVLVRRAELELLADGEADHYIALSHRVAISVPSDYRITNTGAVIVERLPGAKGTRVVSVARGTPCDATSNTNVSVLNDRNFKGDRNVLGHAVLSAISMIAQKRRALAEPAESVVESPNLLPRIRSDTNRTSGTIYNPSSSLEQEYGLRLSNLSSNGYLCLDLEIYLTHEPCVMCAMAMLHSRFSRVVFDQAMPRTGALCAEENSLGHGLFWREQLNWKFLAWQWQTLTPNQHEDDRIDLEFHA